jgi:hypothetical protein
MAMTVFDETQKLRYIRSPEMVNGFKAGEETLF